MTQESGWTSRLATTSSRSAGPWPRFCRSPSGSPWRSQPRWESLLDFVVDPGDADHLLAAVPPNLNAAGLQRSGDGGRTWEPVDGPRLARFAWKEPERLWGAGLDGTVWRSSDGADTWEETGSVRGRREAFADAGERLLVAAGGGIWESVDYGATWTELYRSAQR